MQVLGASSAPRQPPPSDGPGEKSSAPAAAEASAVAVAPADTELPVASKAAAPGLAAEPAADLVLPAAAVIASQVPSTEAVSDSSGASAAPAHAALEGGGLSASAGDRTVETAPLEAPRCAVHAMPCCSTTPAQMILWSSIMGGHGMRNTSESVVQEKEREGEGREVCRVVVRHVRRGADG